LTTKRRKKSLMTLVHLLVDRQLLEAAHVAVVLLKRAPEPAVAAADEDHHPPPRHGVVDVLLTAEEVHPRVAEPEDVVVRGPWYPMDMVLPNLEPLREDCPH
jgi:hypothetical protein